MKKRIELVQLKNGKQAVKCTMLVVLTGSELEKFTHESLKKQIDAAAKDFHVEWGVEQNGGNIQIATLSRTFDVSFGDTEIHAMEIDIANFMRAIEHMHIECDKKKPDDETVTFTEEDIQFVEALFDDWDGKESSVSITGFVPVMKPFDYTRIVIGEFFIPERVAKEMCRLFLKEYYND